VKLVKQKEGDINGFTNKACLYRLTEPFEKEFLDETYTVEYVVLTTSNRTMGESEAALFACDSEGEPFEDMVKLASGGTPRQALFTFIEDYIEELDLDQFIEHSEKGDNRSV
jgi:hypothetical protein